MQHKSTYSKKIFAATITSLLLLAVVPAMSNASAVTTLELCIAIDRSGSIGNTDLGTILSGIDASFQELSVQQGLTNQMAIVSVVSFGDTATLDIAPTTITSNGDASNFGTAVGALGLTTVPTVLTNTEGALLLCQQQFTDPMIAIVDIITDGVPTVSDSGVDNVQDAHDAANAANAAGTVVNALAIGGVDAAFLAELVNGPPAGMVFQTPDIMGFEDAFMDKILMEVGAIGGEILSINASALLVSGFMMNAIWILPTIAATGIAGTGFYLIRSRLNKTSEE